MLKACEAIAGQGARIVHRDLKAGICLRARPRCTPIDQGARFRDLQAHASEGMGRDWDDEDQSRDGSPYNVA